jgi:hypothetical protein
MKKQQAATKKAPPEQTDNRVTERSEPRAQKRIVTQSERDEVKELLRQQVEVNSAEAECNEVRQ